MGVPAHLLCARVLREGFELTNQGIQFPKFYVTAPSPCPYLDGRTERKVFTELKGPDAAALNEALGRVGFRRSQTVVYRPACEGCNACVSVRVRSDDFSPSKSQKRTLKRNSDLVVRRMPAKVTDEQFKLISRYLRARHGDGSMADMTHAEFVEMVETSPVPTHVFEYRRALDQSLLGVALTDDMDDGLSMVYSFFDPTEEGRSLGSFMILDHIREAIRLEKPYVYLGYWVAGSGKMDYKRRFQPLERLGPDGWHEMDPNAKS